MAQTEFAFEEIVMRQPVDTCSFHDADAGEHADDFDEFGWLMADAIYKSTPKIIGAGLTVNTIDSVAAPSRNPRRWVCNRLFAAKSAPRSRAFLGSRAGT